MSKHDIHDILNLLTEEEMAKQVGMKHDLARSQYPLQQLTIEDSNQFHEILLNYLAHHHAHIKRQIPPPHELNDIKTRAIEHAFGRGSIEEAYSMARTGAKGGLRIILDKVCDYLKELEARMYINHIIDTHIDPLNWNTKIEFMKNYFKKFNKYLPENTKPPESFANNYKEFIVLASQTYNKMREGKIQY